MDYCCSLENVWLCDKQGADGQALVDVADLQQGQPEDEDDVVVRVYCAPVVSLARERQLTRRLEHNVVEGPCVNARRGVQEGSAACVCVSARTFVRITRRVCAQHAPNPPARKANIAGLHLVSAAFLE